MAEGHVENGKNLLLERIMRDDSNDIESALERVSLGLKQELYLPEQPIEHVYFPLNGVMSMLAVVDGETLIEVATIGNEGMVGLPLFLGADITPGIAFSQVPGDAYRLRAADFKRMIAKPSYITKVLHRYTQALMMQISQGNACNRAHSNEQRFARWLLLTHDRVGQQQFQLTQEFLSQMLGVRRATINEIAGRFQDAGMIGYSRGVVNVLDRARFEAAACGCYEIIRAEYDRMYAELT